MNHVMEQASRSRNIVLLSDGTGNEPKLSGDSNVLRLYEILVQDDRQLVWYDPGVGTQEDPRALTELGRKAIRFAGQVAGYGLKDNVIDGYAYLMNNYREGDRIFLFGFSRGAFTSRAIAGLLYQVGLLRPGQENLIPYGLKLFWWKQGYDPEKDKTFKRAERFSDKFARRGFQRRREGMIRYLGVWDTVKATGLLRGNVVLPWTAMLLNVQALKHAVSIDERRRPYRPNLLKYTLPAKGEGRFKEAWFAGVHSDVGGTFRDDHGLADIAMEWVVQGGIDQGLLVDSAIFDEFFRRQPAEHALGKIHDMGWFWRITEIGNRRKIVPDGALVHESVRVRSERDGSYRPKLPKDVRWEPWVFSDEPRGLKLI